jgi:hypothetical protein
VPQLRVGVVLPYFLRLSEGDYPTSRGTEVVHVAAPLFQDESTPPRTPMSADFTVKDSSDPTEIREAKERCVNRVAEGINRLLRWYRAASRRANVLELTRSQLSPFVFEVIGGTAPPEWTLPDPVEPPHPQPSPLTTEQLSDAVRTGLATGNEPEVAVLFLLDAQRAMHQGRFREAVLFCWSTIDSVFNRKYDQLAQTALAGEWGDARDFFTGIDFGLRTKMSAGMHLFANRSLFREPDGLWERLSASYRKRNSIIHRGDNATEEDAEQAIAVAEGIIKVMAEV